MNEVAIAQIECNTRVAGNTLSIILSTLRKKKMKNLQFGLLIAMSASLFGCGGGSGGSPQSQPVAVIDPNLTVPFQKAMSSIVIMGINKPYSISGWAGSTTQTPLSGTGTLNSGPAISWTVNSLPVFKTTQISTQNITVNGKQSSGTSTATLYFKTDDYTKIADETATSYNVY